MVDCVKDVVPDPVPESDLPPIVLVAPGGWLLCRTLWCAPLSPAQP